MITISLSDLTTGIKMFKKDFYKKIEIKTNPVGWVFAFEISIKAHIMNFKIEKFHLFLSIDCSVGLLSN